MYTEVVSQLSCANLKKWERLISEAELTKDPLIERTVLLWDGEELVATGSRYNNVLKLIATAASRRGEDLMSTVISELRRDAFLDGHRTLFLYTKPQNEQIFSSLFFYPVAKTEKVLLTEDKKDGIKHFIDSLPHTNTSGSVGAVVMNCNPFTLGHRHLVELAAGECDFVYVFVLSEDRSEFSAKDRMEMVKLGTSHLSNVCVVPTGPYLISSATFPSYFLKNRENLSDVQCLLDVEVFVKHFVPSFKITHRYVGSEPLSPLTATYNEALKKHLPKRGVVLKEIERVKSAGEPISASKVRQLISEGKADSLSPLLPQSTIDYLKAKGYIN